MDFKEKIQNIKNSLTVEDITRLVCDGLGSNGCKFDSSGNPIFQTIDHNLPGEGSYKLYYYVESQTFKSYTGDGDSMDIFELVKRNKNYETFGEAYKYVCDFFNINQDNFRGFTNSREAELVSDWDILNKIDDYKKQNDSEYEILNNNALELYVDAIPQRWIDEGISYEAMKKYNIRMDFANKKIIIPHYDVYGNLVGIRGRSFDEEDLDLGMKYCPVFVEKTCLKHELNKHFYGLNQNKDTIKRLRKVCVAEGEKSVLLGETYYPNNNFTVAMCGSSGFSQKQIDLLLDLGCQEVILAFDKENDDDPNSEKTKDYETKLLKIAQPLTTFFDVYVVFDYHGFLGPKDSPFDRGKEALEELMKQKIFIPSVEEERKRRKSE